jgi:hypothetical protein
MDGIVLFVLLFSIAYLVAIPIYEIYEAKRRRHEP